MFSVTLSVINGPKAGDFCCKWKYWLKTLGYGNITHGVGEIILTQYFSTETFVLYLIKSDMKCIGSISPSE